MSGFAELYVKCLEEQAKLLTEQIKKLKALPKEVAVVDDKKAKKLKRKRAPVDPDAPKKPPSAYQIYFMDAIVPFKAEHPEMTQRDIMTVVGKQWSQFSVAEKQQFVRISEQRKAEYSKAMEAYSGAVAAKQAKTVASDSEADGNSDSDSDSDSDDEAVTAPPVIPAVKPAKVPKAAHVFASVPVAPTPVVAVPAAAVSAEPKKEKSKEHKHHKHHKSEVDTSASAAAVAASTVLATEEKKKKSKKDKKEKSTA